MNGVVVDWINSNVYWTDALYNWVVMAPLRPYSSDRVYRIIVQDGLDNPHGLAVHPAYKSVDLSLSLSVCARARARVCVCVCVCVKT